MPTRRHLFIEAAVTTTALATPATPKTDARNPFHFSNCYDQRSNCTHVSKQGLCTLPESRRYCAFSCGTCSHMVLPVQAAWLHDGYLPIPEDAGPILLEIGASDRNTMDTEMMPHFASAFLVTAEPLLDKYARALGRRRPAKVVHDQLEPLGQHHDRGFILPVAVAPMTAAIGQPEGGGDNADGQIRELKVGPNAGCSSLRLPNRGRHQGSERGKAFGAWCDTTGHGLWKKGRQVWTVPMRKLLEWIGRPVDFVKIDAQGMDLEVFKSGGHMLSLVRRVLLEVISDDCKPVYQNQPTCSTVVEELAALEFEPLTPLPCKPSAHCVCPECCGPGRAHIGPIAPHLMRACAPCTRAPLSLMGLVVVVHVRTGMWRGNRANHRCELEFVFVNRRLNITVNSGTPRERELYLQYHQGHFNWCNGVYPISSGYGDAIICNVPGCDGQPPNYDASPPPPTTGLFGGLFGSGAGLSGRAALPKPPALWADPPPGVVLAAWPGGSGEALPVFYAREWAGRPRKHSEGRPYLCPMSCSAKHHSAGRMHGNATHLLGLRWAELAARKLNCPFW